jgi:D-beta-D-heptose 7-phosphate kinase/D-beta-D-heptose 1-phosphate adenosyltransferase
MEKNGKKIIWVNGCFDILHIGHLKMLEYAKSLGDILVVGIDSDSRVKTLKGEKRPVNKQEDRAEFLLSIKYVDEVRIFDSDESMISHIESSSVDLIVVGEEYSAKKVVGSHLVPVVFFPRVPGFSTTQIIEKEAL